MWSSNYYDGANDFTHARRHAHVGLITLACLSYAKMVAKGSLAPGGLHKGKARGCGERHGSNKSNAIGTPVSPAQTSVSFSFPLKSAPLYLPALHTSTQGIVSSTAYACMRPCGRGLMYDVIC